MKRHGLIGGSTSSTRTTKPFSWLLPVGSSPSVLLRLRTHGLIKKASHCYKYYLTVLGRQTVALGLKLKELVIIPELAAAPSR
ncbi:MAG: hypothetical protein WBL65_04885 [Bryobacteraceae bacterium]